MELEFSISELVVRYMVAEHPGDETTKKAVAERVRLTAVVTLHLPFMEIHFHVLNYFFFGSLQIVCLCKINFIKKNNLYCLLKIYSKNDDRVCPTTMTL